MKFWLSAICSFSLTLVSLSQDLASIEERMAEVQYTVGTAETDREREDASAELSRLFLKAFKVEGVFDYPFSTLYKVGILESGDGAFRLFTWNRPATDGTFFYHAYLLYPDDKGYVELVHSPSENEISSDKIYAENDWYGALYYHIIPVKHKGATYYTLIGWDGSKRKSNLRILDALSIDKKGRLSFGRPVFETADRFAERRVFEYAKEAKMLLDWLAPRQAIVFNDLAPITGAAEGNYAFYGPSGAYHSYSLEAGRWILDEYIDMSRPKGEESKAQFNFPARPDLNKAREPANPLIGK